MIDYRFYNWYQKQFQYLAEVLIHVYNKRVQIKKSMFEMLG